MGEFRAAYPESVHEGSVQAAEILDRVSTLAPFDACMSSRHGDVVKEDPTSRVAA
jgi:hypothetical protein